MGTVVFLRGEGDADGGAGREVFLTLWRRAPDAAALARAARVLAARVDSDAGAAADDGEGAAGFALVPRFGLVSAWSDKAGDVLRRCGVTDLARVERGWFYRNGDAALAERVCDNLLQTALFGDWRAAWRRGVCEVGAAAADDVVRLAGGGDLAAAALARENAARGWGLCAAEIEYLAARYGEWRREATVAELMLFAQANSEHCRHKMFFGEWRVAGAAAPSPMALILRTHELAPQGVITAFDDNAAVLDGGAAALFAAGADDAYAARRDNVFITAKAETHNHPTAIAPFAGAATGCGGEIRDHAATGRGAAARAGFCGYMVSGVGQAPGAGDSRQLAEAEKSCFAPPPHVASARRIITEAPLGAAAFCNEFGRPTLAGFFASFEGAAAAVEGDGDGAAARRFGFGKPVMLAGGIGHILPVSAGKRAVPAGAYLVQLGGCGYRVGLGGGAAASAGGGGDAARAAASVQRDNAEMQRRAQMALDALRVLPDNPILSLHDVGAGGLGVALCEMAHAAGRGALLRLDDVPVGDAGMSAAEILCNEAQERFVLAILPDELARLAAVCERERCPFAVIGEATAAREFVALRGEAVAARWPLAALLEEAPRAVVRAAAVPAVAAAGVGAALAVADLEAAALAVLRHPTVACKRFLVTIADRTVGGLTAREQMVGPWQTPVADCAAICHDFFGAGGAAFALGERAAAAAADVAAAARLAVAEALFNLHAGEVELSRVKLSLNWMGNCAGEDLQEQAGAAGQGERPAETRAGELHAAVQAASDFCAALGVGVITGKDSLAMRMPLATGGVVESPALAVACAFAPVGDVRRILTPQLSGVEDTYLLRVGLGDGLSFPALAGSVADAAGVFADAGGRVADAPALQVRAALAVLARARREGLILSYHDCSDGGAWAALCEMGFAANAGVEIYADTFADAAPDTDGGGKDGWAAKSAAALFCEEPAAIVEARREGAKRLLQIADEVNAELAEGSGQGGAALVNVQTVARPNGDKMVRVYGGGKTLLEKPLAELRRAWEAIGAGIARERDNPACAEAEAERDVEGDPGLFARLPDGLPAPIAHGLWAAAAGAAAQGELARGAAAVHSVHIGGALPRVAIVREAGCHGHVEMAAAFAAAGFAAVDVTMQDLLCGRHDLRADFAGAALCGGFSYGDALGAGRGWALGILHEARLRDMFSEFFADARRFALGVCNGAQALCGLQELMPGAGEWRWPRFLQNESGRFEARLCMAEVLPCESFWFEGMAGLALPLVVSHGEGRAVFAEGDEGAGGAVAGGGARSARAKTALRFVDNFGAVAEAGAYPANPNGSADGAAGFVSPDGRVAALMPHPERVFLRVQMGWLPPALEGYSDEWTPWKVLFDNARRFAG